MDFAKKLQQGGLKATPGRIALLEYIYNSNAPLSYDDIKDSLSIDKATFYRSVSAFEENEILNSIEAPDKRRYYEFRRDAHLHFICQKCGKIECLDEKMLVLSGYKIETIIVKGYCVECNA